MVEPHVVDHDGDGRPPLGGGGRHAEPPPGRQSPPAAARRRAAARAADEARPRRTRRGRPGRPAAGASRTARPAASRRAGRRRRRRAGGSPPAMTRPSTRRAPAGSARRRGAGRGDRAGAWERPIAGPRAPMPPAPSLGVNPIPRGRARRATRCCLIRHSIPPRFFRFCESPAHAIERAGIFHARPGTARGPGPTGSTGTATAAQDGANDPVDRQLRQLHLQPRAFPRRRGGALRGAPQRRADAWTRRWRSRPRRSCCRPAPARRTRPASAST